VGVVAWFMGRDSATWLPFIRAAVCGWPTSRRTANLPRN